MTFEAGVDAPDMNTVSYILLDDVIGLEPDQVFTVNLDVVTPIFYQAGYCDYH